MRAAGHRQFWMVFAGPLVWFAHFLASYVTVAVWCARFTPDGGLGPARWLLAALTAAAIVGELLVAWYGFEAHRHGFAIDPVHDEATSDERRRFLGFATWLLAGLSLTATVYVALPLWFLTRCS